MRRSGLWLALVIAAAGCGSANTVAVRGRVLIDDKPVSNATVMFMPASGKGHPASGFTDADGVFQLTSFTSNDGAVRGEYVVVVSRSDAAPPPPDAEPGNTGSVISHYKGLKAKRPKSPPLPEIYADAAKSPLRAKVPPDGEVVLRLDSKAK